MAPAVVRGCASCLMLSTAIMGMTTLVEGVSLKDCNDFFDLDFSIAEVDRYEEFFTNETELVLAQAGIFRGPEDIREYVKFARADSPFVDLDIERVASPTLAGWTAEGWCAFRIMRLVDYRLADKYTEDGVSFQVANMIAIDYDPPSNKITRFHIYFDARFLKWIFSEQLDNREVWNWICGVMENDCEDVWANDPELTSRDACVAKLEALPVIDGDDAEHRFDGNTGACRILHGIFAASDSKHCAHISFLPMEDPGGHIKCQESANLSVSEYFSELDVENFEQFKDLLDIPETSYERIDDLRRDDLNLFGVGRDLDMDASPMSRLSDKSFRYAAAIVAWFTVCYTGFGSEIVIGLWLYQRLGASQRDALDRYWKVSQFIFPLFLLISLVSASTYGYFFLAVGLWKAGSPEVLFYLSRFVSPGRCVRDRIHGFFGGFGLIIHHCTASWCIVCIIQHIFPLDRITLSMCMPLVIQHTTALVKYVSYPAYIVLCLLVEVWFEWEILYYRNKRDNNQRICCWLMLICHWMFLFDYTVEIFWSCVSRRMRSSTMRQRVDYKDVEAKVEHDKIQIGIEHVSVLSDEVKGQSRRPTVARFLVELEPFMKTKKTGDQVNTPST